jgi:hypothetical protein
MYKCKHCKEEFNYPEEVVFFDESGYDISYQEAWDNGYTHIACNTCIDENSN